MSRAIFVGSNPSAISNNTIAFDSSTKSGKLIREWNDAAGIDISYYINVANSPTPDNRPLKKSEVVSGLKRLKEEIDWYQGMNTEEVRLVAVGKTAALALTLLGLPYYEMPHPSGLNRKLNDPAFVAEKINGLRDYLNPSKIE